MRVKCTRKYWACDVPVWKDLIHCKNCVFYVRTSRSFEYDGGFCTLYESSPYLEDSDEPLRVSGGGCGCQHYTVYAVKYSDDPG